MASAINLVRMPPEAPTSAPAMIRTGLPTTKPAIAAAVPVNELSSEMTTGMSAPPMGSTSVMPKISAASTIKPSTAIWSSAVSTSNPAAARTRMIRPATATSAVRAVTSREPGKMIG